MSFTVTTWNVLAQAYIKPERYVGVDARWLEAGPRLNRIVERIRQLNSDVFLLQEVEPLVMEAIAAAMPQHDVHLELKQRKPDGSAILARRSLDLGARHAIHYDAVEPGYDHVGVAWELRPEGRPLIVASTHLRWQRRDTPEESHLGQLQLSELLMMLERLPTAAWIVGGDFNAGHRGPVLERAFERGLSMCARSLRPWDTALINGNRRKLDYLLTHESHLRPEPNPLPSLSKQTPIPSEVEPSDHLPLTSVFHWN